jgi:hypothetical protein
MYIEQRGEQCSVLYRFNADLSQRIYQVSKPLRGRYIRPAKTKTAPFSDWMQRCVLQQL